MIDLFPKKVKRKGFIMPHPTGPTNHSVVKLAIELRKTKEKSLIDVAKHIEKSRRSKNPVNISRLQKLSKKYNIFIVPGKVLGVGTLEKGIDVYASSFSKDAKDKITKAGGNAYPLSRIIKDNAKGRVVV